LNTNTILNILIFKKWASGTAHYLFYSNLFISFTAFFYAKGCARLLGGFKGENTYLWALLLATLFIYTLHRWISFSGKWGRTPNLRKPAMTKVLTIYPYLLGFSTPLLFYISLYKAEYDHAELLIPFFLSIFYTIPLFNGKRLRDFPYTKSLLTAVVWSYLAVFFPASQGNGFHVKEGLFFLSQICLIFCLILPLDYRDKEKDARTGTKTFSNTLTLKAVRSLGFLCLNIGMVCYFYLWWIEWMHGSALLALLFCLWLTYRTLLSFVNYTKDWQYNLYTDGIMLLQGVLLSMSPILTSSLGG
jgi:hypothetical protein